MKFYLVKRSGGVDRWFTKQSDLTNFLINVIGDEECQVITLDSEPQSEISHKEFLKQLGDEKATTETPTERSVGNGGFKLFYGTS